MFWLGVEMGERVVAVGFPAGSFVRLSMRSVGTVHTRGWLPLSKGATRTAPSVSCRPTRGPERCRPIADILAEVDDLVSKGFLEIELLGQTVNHWRQPGGELGFAELLEAVATTPGVERLRFVTSYPRDFHSGDGRPDRATSRTSAPTSTYLSSLGRTGFYGRWDAVTPCRSIAK